MCRKCGKKLGEVIKNKTNEPLYINPCKTCDECKKKNAEKSRVSMKLNNPANNQTFNSIEEYEKDKKEKQEAREATIFHNKQKNSERMKTNNPMFNPNTKNKVKETLQKKKEKREFPKHTQKNRKDFNGKRGTKRYLRIALKQWRKDALAKANYACEEYGKTRVFLHVHHKIPFSQIVDEQANKLNIDIDKVEFLSKEYLTLEEKVIEFHNNNDIAQVLCEDCHDKIDKHFHKQKNMSEKGIRKYNGSY